MIDENIVYVKIKNGIFKCYKSEQMHKPIYYPVESKTNGYIDYNDVEKILTIEDLYQENKELKKQLEEYKRLGFKHLNDKCNKLENQQKEFIEYLENYIKEMSIQNINSHPSRQIILEAIIDTLKANLSKYKEINHINDVGEMGE